MRIPTLRQLETAVARFIRRLDPDCLERARQRRIAASIRRLIVTLEVMSDDEERLGHHGNARSMRETAAIHRAQLETRTSRL